jgi:hypothetical protein
MECVKAAYYRFPNLISPRNSFTLEKCKTPMKLRTRPKIIMIIITPMMMMMVLNKDGRSTYY